MYSKYISTRSRSLFPSVCAYVCVSACMCVFVDFKNVSVLFKFLFLNVCVLQFVGGEPHTVGPRQPSVALI